MIHRVLHQWSRHGIVSPEGNETLSRRHRKFRGTSREQSGANELVQQRVRMTEIDVTLAVNASVELASLERRAFEVESQISNEVPAVRCEHCHHHWLCEITFGERTIRNARRCNCSEQNCARARRCDRSAS